MKVYQLFTKSGNCYELKATEWQAARRKSRDLCKKENEQFSTVRLLKEATKPIFAPAQAPQRKTKNLSKYLQQIVCFEMHDSRGKWVGMFWGTLTAISPDGTPTVVVRGKAYHPQPNRVSATGRKTETTPPRWLNTQ